MDIQVVITLIVLILLGFIGFCIYFIFKVLQFVIQAINLYKDMITRQDMIIRLLKNTQPGYERNSQTKTQKPDYDETSIFCTNCGEKLPSNSSQCPACGTQVS